MPQELSVPLNDTIIIAVSQLVDDAQAERREPSHSDLGYVIARHGLSRGDPSGPGRPVGKAKRVKSTLNWAMEYDPAAGGRFLAALISAIRGHGGFRETSPNFVGADAYRNAAEALSTEGYELSDQGDLRPKLLDNLSGTELTDALQAYVRRAKRGAEDAALVTGTGKDLLEATAAHVLQRRFGSYRTTANFPTLLGQAFITLGLATTQDPIVEGEQPEKRLERALFELACAVNHLRNKQGTGHGRPWVSTVTIPDARMATELMGVLAERLLR